MANNITKGNYYKKRTKDFFIKDGWRVEGCEKNQRLFIPGKPVIFIKRDFWGADLMAVRDDEMMMIQCKTNKGDISKGLREFEKYPMPKWCRQVVVYWPPKAHEPEVVEVEHDENTPFQSEDEECAAKLKAGCKVHYAKKK